MLLACEKTLRVAGGFLAGEGGLIVSPELNVTCYQAGKKGPQQNEIYIFCLVIVENKGTPKKEKQKRKEQEKRGELLSGEAARAT